MTDIDFYFDFLSPYGYLAARRIEAIAERHGRRLTWRPFRLGVAVVKVMGLRPNMETPLKAPYILRDVERLATVFGAPLAPAGRLDNPLLPAQLFYGAPISAQPQLARALFEAHWAHGRNIGDPETLVAIALSHGLSERDARDALTSAETRRALSRQTEAAIERGVFGSPTFAVGDELFWGVDRLWLLEHFLNHDQRFAPLGQGDALEAQR